MALSNIEDYLRLVPAVRRSPRGFLWASYARQADTLYINFKKTSHATDSELTEDDGIVRYEDDKVVGLSVLHAHKRTPATTARPAILREKPTKKYGRK